MKKSAVLKSILLSVVCVSVFVEFTVAGARYMENLDRGVVAVRTNSSQVYIGWRMLGTEWSQNIGYHVYHNGTRITSSPITTSTNYVHSISTDGTYGVSAVIDGVEGIVSNSVGVLSTNYLSVPLQIPAGVTTPDGVTCIYRANDCSVGDIDGDGQYEIIVKWDPSNSKDNANSGYTGNVYLDAYKLNGTFLWRIDLGINIRAGAHYTQFMVYDLDSDGKAEVACKTAPGTVDGLGNNVLMGSDSPTADYRNSSGYILTGPEYLTVFNGQTGAAMATTGYNPPRGTVSSWGDSYGNRVDRFLACVAYLDGVRPSLVMCRGYYTRAVLAAWDWRGGQLTQRWVFDSNNGYSSYAGQGNHNLSVGDVEGDGKDEIIYGACAIDDNGTGLYSTGLAHGDAMHLSDMDPDRPGLEVWQCHEGGSGSTFRDAATGAIIFQFTSTGDVGRACAGHMATGTIGYQMWANTSGLRDRYGNNIGRAPGSTNFVIWWDGDLARELLNGSNNDMENQNSYTPPAVTTPPVIDKYGSSSDTRLLTATSCYSNNSTKATPCLSADIFGDWREEVIFRTADNTALRIYTTTTVTTNRLYTLMHDPQYRLAIAWQNTAYNQPPHPSFYIGTGMAIPPTPQILLPGPVLYGDFNGDDKVNINDLPHFLNYWLVHDCIQTASLDLNGDCIINYVEFSALAANWSGPDTIAPAAPTGLSAVVGDVTVSLDWNDNNESDLSGYNLYRSTTSGGGYVKLNAALLSSSNYTDNDVTNGTTYYYVVTAVDISLNESGYLNEVSATPNLVIQENTAGFCTYDGTIDNNNAGFTGTGFVNTPNAAGSGINWSISVPAAGTYRLTWRYSNGSGSRPGNLIVNGLTAVSGIAFPVTATWTTWSEVSVNVDLSVGIQTLRLEATSSNGLANIDYLMVAGYSPQPASCQ
jgi:rhamnogalacturonan endolyase